MSALRMLLRVVSPIGALGSDWLHRKRLMNEVPATGGGWSWPAATTEHVTAAAFPDTAPFGVAEDGAPDDPIGRMTYRLVRLRYAPNTLATFASGPGPTQITLFLRDFAPGLAGQYVAAETLWETRNGGQVPAASTLAVEQPGLFAQIYNAVSDVYAQTFG